MKNTADDSPLTNGDLKEFCTLLCTGLNPPQTGALVPPHEVIGLHSTDEDGEGNTVRLYDLYGGRTGCQVGEGGIRYAD